MVPLSVELSRQEYWSGLPSPLPGDLPDLGIKPRSPTLQVDSLPGILSHQGSPLNSSSFLNFPQAFWLAVCYVFWNHRLWCGRALHTVCSAHSPGVWAAITMCSPGTCLHLPGTSSLWECTAFPSGHLFWHFPNRKLSYIKRGCFLVSFNFLSPLLIGHLFKI